MLWFLKLSYILTTLYMPSKCHGQCKTFKHMHTKKKFSNQKDIKNRKQSQCYKWCFLFSAVRYSYYFFFIMHRLVKKLYVQHFKCSAIWNIICIHFSSHFLFHKTKSLGIGGCNPVAAEVYSDYTLLAGYLLLPTEVLKGGNTN